MLNRMNCPCCDYKKALSITVKDGKTLYYCHAGCPQDSLWRVMRVEGALTHQPTLKSHQRFPNESAKAYALELWRSSLSACDSLVKAHLAGRGLTNAVPDSIRFLPDHLHNPTKTRWPVMLAAVTDCIGRVEAVHRTYLARGGTGKAPVEPAKMTLGSIGGFAVHLAPAATTLAITEGIETGLSVQQISGIPTWAAISAGGMRQLILPPLPLAQEVIICADNDPNGCGQKAAHEAASYWLDEGRRVRVSLPPVVGTDFNDVTAKIQMKENSHAFA